MGKSPKQVEHFSNENALSSQHAPQRESDRERRGAPRVQPKERDNRDNRFHFEMGSLSHLNQECWCV